MGCLGIGQVRKVKDSAANATDCQAFDAAAVSSADDDNLPVDPLSGTPLPVR